MCSNTSRKNNILFTIRLNNELYFLIVLPILICSINPISGKRDEKIHWLAGKVLLFRMQLSGLSHHARRQRKKFSGTCTFVCLSKASEGTLLQFRNVTAYLLLTFFNYFSM